MSTRLDSRLRADRWDPLPAGVGVRRRVRILLLLGIPFAIWYFGWLLQPARIGNPVLYGILITAELFNLFQALGFWWTCASERVRRTPPADVLGPVSVDVFVPVYDEPVDIVELTVAAAARIRGDDVRPWLLDDGDREEMRELAERNGVGYLRRPEHSGAKAGNINHALTRTEAQFIVILDSDHVADPRFLEATLGHMEDPGMAFVQTPQYYANASSGGIAAASWGQQALFFGAIARGKDGLGAMFCCGTNVLFRRAALEDSGGFPTDSVTEDFELSIGLHERGWRSAYVSEVLARGLGPEDMASYVSQQQRWARGCLSGLTRVLGSRGLPWRIRLQYALSSVYWLTGWTVLIYMSFPAIRILTGAQPLEGISADEFLIHFAPWFTVALATVAVAGAGTYTFSAFAVASASFWIHVRASILTLLGRRGKFVVTPKEGAGVRQPKAVLPTLAIAALLVGVSIYGLLRAQDAATLNNVAFALVHVTILMAGAWSALARPRRPRPSTGTPQPAALGRATA